MRFAAAVVLCLWPSIAAAQLQTQVLHAFATSPAGPSGALLETPDGSFYGLAASGLYRRAPGGQVTAVAGLAGPGVGALLRGGDGALYGATSGDADGQGRIFRFDPATAEVRILHDFTGVNGGRGPLGGLVAVGAFLYGVTTGEGPSGQGTIFRVESSTGAFTVLHAFTDAGTAPAWYPWGPLALGPDGMLYGTTRFGGSEEAGTIYRLDPNTGAFTVVHGMTVAEGIGPVGPMLLDTDARFYGSAYAGGDQGAGTIFRFDPATSQVQRLYSLATSTDGVLPGPLAKAADGHLYGTATFRATPSGPSVSRVFRVRRTPGVAFEIVRALDPAVDGRSEPALLTLGSDALLYGYAQTGGPTGTGSIYRFDPAAGGPAPDPTQFTVLHAFPGVTASPTRPTPTADGFLMGTTRFGGATGRGQVYRLSRSDGAVTLLGTLPGAVGATGVANSPLVEGLDGFLYGTTYATSDAGSENRVVRVDAATGAATAVYTRTDSAGGPVFQGGLVRTPAGQLYGLRRADLGLTVYRFDRVTNTVTDVATLSTTSLFVVSELLAAGDGELYLTAVALVPTPGRPGVPGPPSPSAAELLRVNPGTGAIDVIQSLGTSFLISNPVSGPGGTVYVGLSNGFDPRVIQVHPTTGGLQTVCTLPAEGYAENLSLGPDGVLRGTLALRRRELFACNPTTHAAVVEFLSPQVGSVIEPFVAVATDGLIYGAAWAGGPLGGGTLFRIAPTLTPPALDSDTDGLPNTWETDYGLNPFSSTAADGATGDADGDGVTNAQELAAGTHPRGFLTRYFAEGATGPFFQTRIDIGNPAIVAPAIVLLRFQTDTGATVPYRVIVPPSSHVSVDPATLTGLAHANFSTVVESDETIAVNRTMTWDPTGYGSHLETGITAPSTTWYFAEGSTSGDFALFYLLQNPQATAITATVRYLRPFGQPPIEKTYTLPPHSRTTLAVDDQGAELASTDLSAVITATAPIVAERAMYLSRPGQPFMAGHESAGVTAPAEEWFLAEGATGAFFDLFVLMANPGSTDAAVTVEYLLAGGGSLTKNYVVPANGRTTIWVDDEQIPAGSGQRPLASAALSTTVRSTNAVPIIVERSMWWPGPSVTANFWYEAHNSPGATAAATRWSVGGGEVGGPNAAETYVLLANPGTTAGRARVTVFFDSGATTFKTYDLPAKSRTNVPIGADFFVPPVGAGLTPRFSVVVESLGWPPVPIVVESATYASPGGVTWAAGGNALAAPMP